MPANSEGLEDADLRLFKVQMAMAEQGKPRAQYYLGEMHEQGLGTKQDVDEAFKWYAKAAEQGDPLAQRKMSLRKEIMNEIRKEQEAEQRNAPKSTVIPEKPAVKSKITAAPAPTAPATVAQNDLVRQEAEDRIKAAEKQKRRAAVRAMILERIRNPVGELFE
jgi:TPR repeat protein